MLNLRARKSNLIYAMLIAISILIFVNQASMAFQSPSQGAFDRAGKSGVEPANAAPPVKQAEDSGLSVLNLLFQGGWFMLPLLALSILVVLVTIERFISTRKDKILPDMLTTEIGQLSTQRGGFDPRDAYKICQKYPSAAGRIVQMMLQRVGRPMIEVEKAVNDTSQREAEKVHSNVKWLTFAAAVAPLIGLLGTVWGMIQAFYDTTQLTPDQNKVDVLAAGIYIALVTTLCGLVIAIPAAVFAHFFENRITAMFHRIEEFVFNLMPQVEKYEGQLRFNISESTSSRDDGPDTNDTNSSESSARTRESTPVRT